MIATSICLLSPTELTIRADVSKQLTGNVQHWNRGVNYGGGTLGHIGFELPVVTYRTFSLRAGYVHESLIDTDHDRGEERVTLGFVYRPFGGAR
jgi:hypothetical protein